MKPNNVYDIRNTTRRRSSDMPAPREEPYTKLCITLPDRVIERIAKYPGKQSHKIEMLLEYALDMGALMSPEEAVEIAQAKAMQLIHTVGLPTQKGKKKA